MIVRNVLVNVENVIRKMVSVLVVKPLKIEDNSLIVNVILAFLIMGLAVRSVNIPVKIVMV